MTNLFNSRLEGHAKRIVSIFLALMLGVLLAGAVSAPSANAATSTGSSMTLMSTSTVKTVTGNKTIDKKIAALAKKNSNNLKKCFNWCANNIKYCATGNKAIRSDATWAASRIKSEAKLAFISKKGDCYTYATAVYCFAKYLGYTTRAVAGTSLNTDGETLHTSWAEIKISGKWYIFDALHPSYGYKVPVGKYTTAWQHYSK